MDSFNLTVALLSELAFALAVICIVLAVMLHKFSCRNRKLRKHLLRLKAASPSELDDERVLSYLSRQLEATAGRVHTSLMSEPNESTAADASAEISEWVLRKQYLQAEREALMAGEDAGNYWQTLATALQELLEKLRVATPAAEELAQWKNKVNILRERLSRLRDYERRCVEAEQALTETRSELAKLENQAAQSAVDIATARVVGGEEVPLFARSGQHADFISDKVNDQRRTIFDLRESLRQYQLQLEVMSQNSAAGEQDKSIRDKLAAMERELAEAECSSSLLKVEVDGLKKALKEAEGQVLKAEYGRVDSSQPEFWQRAGRHGKDVDDDNVVFVHEEAASTTEIGDVALEYARAAYARAEQEVKNLMEVSQRQRGLILELENELHLLREQLKNDDGQDPRGREEKQQALTRMEQMYRESEMCVAVLESEVEDLQQRLGQMSQDLAEDKVAFIEALQAPDEVTAPAAPPPAAPSQELESLKAELDQLNALQQETMAAYNDQSTIAQFAALCWQCRDLGELSRELMATINAMGLTAAIQMRSELGKVDSCDIGKITSQDKANLASIKYSGGDHITPVKDGFVVASDNVSLLVKKPDATGSELKRLQQTLISLLSLTSSAMEKIEHGTIRDKQQKSLDKLVGGIDRAMANISVQYKYQTDEANRIVNRLLKEFHQSLGSMALSEVQKSVFKGMMDDCQQRMALLFATGLSLDESMEKLLVAIKQRKL